LGRPAQKIRKGEEGDKDHLTEKVTRDKGGALSEKAERMWVIALRPNRVNLNPTSKKTIEPIRDQELFGFPPPEKTKKKSAVKVFG